jgi:hypothetical protein
MLEQRLAEARNRGEQGHRRLLTASGDELVNEVERVLKLFEFDVVNVDKQLSKGEPKREDLRVSDADGWIALVEVKGPRGGAKVGDLIQLQQHLIMYQREFNSSPSATWYVVNQFPGHDPVRRPTVLDSDPEARRRFFDGSGVAIDTTALFRLAVAVTSGGLERDKARDMLKSSSGVFTYTSPNSS